MLNIGKSSAYGLLQNNEIKHVKLGRKYIIPKNAVIGLFDNICYNTEEQTIDGGLSSVERS